MQKPYLPMIPLTIITRWWGAGLGAAAAAASKKSWPAESASALKQPRPIRRSSSILRERVGRAGLDPGSKKQQQRRSSERVGSIVGMGSLGRSTEPESEASMKEGLMLFAWFSLFSAERKHTKLLWFDLGNLFAVVAWGWRDREQLPVEWFPRLTWPHQLPWSMLTTLFYCNFNPPCG